MPTRTSTRKGSGRRRVSSKTKSTRPKSRATSSVKGRPGAAGPKSAGRKHSPRRSFTQMLAGVRDWIRSALGRQTDDVWGMVLIVIAVLVTLAYFRLAGPVGDGLTSGSRFLFGVWRFAMPLAFGRHRPDHDHRQASRRGASAGHRRDHHFHRHPRPLPSPHRSRGVPLVAGAGPRARGSGRVADRFPTAPGPRALGRLRHLGVGDRDGCPADDADLGP